MPHKAINAPTCCIAPEGNGFFNGQQAFVSDTTQTPFVISSVDSWSSATSPRTAAGDPAWSLSEGTFMTVQAVISNDRRFVRLTIVPYFSK